MGTGIDTGTAFNTFLIINLDPQLFVLIKAPHIGVPHRTHPDTGIAPNTFVRPYINYTHNPFLLLSVSHTLCHPMLSRSFLNYK